jgi:hypothetical protein
MGRVFPEVTRGSPRPLHSANLCYNDPVSGMERRRFESGDQTPGGAVQDVLVSLSAGLALYGF